MGHYRQYALRGSVGIRPTDPPPSQLQPPVFWAGAHSGGWPVTLTAVIGSPHGYYMQIYNSAAPEGIIMSGVFGTVAGSPSIQFVSDDYGPNYYTRLTQNADGSGFAGPFSAVYHPAY